MKGNHLTTIALALSLLISIITPAQSATKTGVVTGGIAYSIPPWFKNSFLEIADDVGEANASNKHVLLFFHLDECAYCNNMVKDFDQQPLKSLIQHFDVIAINIRGDREVAIDENQTLTEKQLATKVGVQYAPTVLFLNQANTVVARTNGYRGPNQLRHVLDYMHTKAYQKSTLATYIASTKKTNVYALENHNMYQKIDDLSHIKTPLAVVFEDKSCEACEYFYNTTLKNKAVKSEFGAFNVVRFDADSTQTIIDNMGNKTTPKAWAQQLKLNYRPGIVLFDQGNEVVRIDSFLYPFHFKEALRYVGAGFYQKFATYWLYLEYREKQLLGQGIDINVGELNNNL